MLVSVVLLVLKTHPSCEKYDIYLTINYQLCMELERSDFVVQKGKLGSAQKL